MDYASGVRENVKGYLWEKENLKQTGAIRLLKFVVSAEVRILILPLLFITHIRCFRFISVQVNRPDGREIDGLLF